MTLDCSFSLISFFFRIAFFSDFQISGFFFFLGGRGGGGDCFNLYAKLMTTTLMHRKCRICQPLKFLFPFFLQQFSEYICWHRHSMAD